jgi:hypothetical protein
MRGLPGKWLPCLARPQCETDLSVIVLASHTVTRTDTAYGEVFLAWRVREGSVGLLLGSCETAQQAPSLCEADAKGLLGAREPPSPDPPPPPPSAAA